MSMDLNFWKYKEDTAHVSRFAQNVTELRAKRN